MKSGGYHSYRGRAPLHNVLKIIVVVLAILLVLALAAFFFFQRYLVYSSDGVHLELPFSQSAGADKTAPPAETADGTQTEPVTVVTPTAAQPSWLHAVSLPLSALSDGTAEQQVNAAGGNAAIFDMKADDGSLGYVSQLPLAIAAKVSSGDPNLNAAIQTLTATDLYTVARVSCFKDNALSDADRTLAILTNSGYRWTDPDNVRWVSPTNETVRQYVTDVCVELAKLGFDEILLDNSGYPTAGNLGYIKKGSAYDKSAFSAVIGGFYAQTAQALEEYHVRLSIVTDAATVTAGQNALSGQTLADLSAYAGRVWLTDGNDTAVKALTDAGLKQENVVSLTGQPGGESSSWAVLMQEQASKTAQ